MKNTLHLSALVKYSSLSALTLALASPLMAIERPTPAQQPEEMQEFQPQSAKAEPIPLPQNEKLTYLGIYGSPLSADLSNRLKIEKGHGISLELIAPNSPAAKAGLKKQSVILKIAGQDIKSMEDVRNVVTSKKNGDTVEIDIITDGEQVKKQVTLTERDAPNTAHAFHSKTRRNLGQLNDSKELLNRALAKEFLDKFPELDRERLMRLFKKNEIKLRLQHLEKKLGQLQEMEPQIPKFPQNLDNGLKDPFRNSVKMLNQNGSIALESTPGGKIIEIKDKAGKVQFRGPYNNDIDKQNIPEELRARVEYLNINDKMELLKKPKLNIAEAKEIKPKLAPDPEQNDENALKEKANVRVKNFIFNQSIKFVRTDPETGNKYTFIDKNEKKQVEVLDADGKLIYNGPYNNEQEQASLPEELRPMLKQLIRDLKLNQ